jgi:hypothetical protein
LLTYSISDTGIVLDLTFDEIPLSFVAAMAACRHWWGCSDLEKQHKDRTCETLVEIFKRRHKFRKGTYK